jgi:hypothetical protein
MAHEDWLKYCQPKSCAECMEDGEPCTLGESMPCSPDCEGIDPATGEPAGGEVCEGCDAIKEEAEPMKKFVVEVGALYEVEAVDRYEVEEKAVQEFDQDVQDAVKRCGRIDFMSTEVVEESGDDADLDRQIWGTNWCWWDAVELMGELKDVFLALPKEQKEALMDKHERSISKGMEAGIMTDWTVVMEAAIECSGLLEDLEMLKEGGDVSDEEETRMGASEQDED